jgi:hypothetical protein
MLSATTRACGRLGVLYKDRGVIVLNKPPGLVSQGTSSTAASAKNDGPETTPPRTAFDNVLDGTVQPFIHFACRGENLSTMRLTVGHIQASDACTALVQIRFPSIG